jgi:hypothetical protein
VSTSQRVSRGFHRLGLLLAAIPLLAGAAFYFFLAFDTANDAQRLHDEQMAFICAQEAIYKKFYSDMSRDEFDRKAAELADPGKFNLTGPQFDLKELGCSDQSKTASALEIFRDRAPGEFSWRAKLWSQLSFGLAISLGVALAVYGLVRAIGWVIGGFAVS